ncbi:MAG: histidinol-phosphatase [Spirochaetales bacterium]|uniref:Histidinol-phosphatase n=1 Tax=Candidatus Thalassospirochaeta sargassi TaxID=3119039 RepID=A0AAJ1IBL9_9SPIO|nr:histidinol-phosphatase [Spirochaetales bacterium]
MILSNYHSHFNLDDGYGELSDYAESAIERGLSIIGVSPHAPLCYLNDWTLSEANLDAYAASIPGFKADYEDRLEIYGGLEVDFIPGGMGPADVRYHSLGLDYRIGSVHSIEDTSRGEHLSVDGPLAEMELLLQETFGGDIKALVRRYFELEMEMLELGGFDILGHCDLVKKRNIDNRFFNQDEKWYRNEALQMLQLASKKDVVVEVNTGGLSRGATVEVYPSRWMLEHCYELKIPITLSSDAHNPDHIDYYFQESINLLKSVGYGEIYFFSKGQWRSQPIL